MFKKIMSHIYFVKIIYLIFVGYLFFAYFMVGSYVVKNTTIDGFYNVGLPIDYKLPFISSGIWIYLSYYIVLLFPFLFFKSKKEIVQVSANLLILSSISHIIFILFPVASLRNAEYLTGDIGSRIIAGIYSLDTNVNCLPSLHVAHCVVIALYCFKLDYLSKWVKLSGISIAILMGPAAVFIKQHFIIDIIAAWTLCLILEKLNYCNLKSRSFKKSSV